MEGDPAAAVAAAQQPVKRKRGRPRKSEMTTTGTQGMTTTTTTPGGVGVTSLTTPGTDSAWKPKKQRKRKGDTGGGAPVSSVDVSMMGQPVTGVLEGTFDAGYLLSVRVGTSDTILRGVVFGPGLSVPLSKLNDVAPGVKHVRREEKPLPLPLSLPPPTPKPMVPAAVAPKALHAPLPSFLVPANLPPASAIPPTSAVLESAAALFGNSISASPSPAPASTTTGLVAALQQLPGGGYTPDPATFSPATFQPESVKSL